LPDLNNLDLSEFEQKPEEELEPILTVKQLSKQSDIIDFDEFYRLHWACNWRVISFLVGLESVKEFNNKRDVAEVAYRRMASYSTTKRLLKRGSQLVADIITIGTGMSEVMPKINAERENKKKAKTSLKGGGNHEEQTDFSQFVAR